MAFAVNEIGMAFFLALIAQEVSKRSCPAAPCTRGVAGGCRWPRPRAASGRCCGLSRLRHLKYEMVLAPAWPIACAIDIAAAYYVLKTILRRGSALPFLLLLAIATDAFGLLVVALRSAAGRHHARPLRC